MLADRLAESTALLRILDALFEGRLRQPNAQRADANAPVVERRHCLMEAAPHFAEHRVGRDAYAVKAQHVCW